MNYNSIVTSSVVSRSKLLFGNMHMLHIAGSIGSGGDVVDSKSLQAELGLGQSTVQRTLVALEGVGLMERIERHRPTEPLRFRRVEHSFWAAARELVDA